MFDRMLGRYLVETGQLTEEQLQEVYRVQEQTRAKLGVIAVGEKLMSVAQAEEVNAAQAIEDKRFGDLAVEKGYLTAEQLQRLIRMQGSAFHTFTQVIDDKGFLTLEEIKRAMNDYQKEHELLPRDMDALVEGDLGRITRMHLPTDDADLLALFTYAIKNMFRLVDRHVSIEKGAKENAVDTQVLACQELRGDIDATVMLFGSYEDLRGLAVAYTQEEFIETKEDVLDAMSELINTNSGLFLREYFGREHKKAELVPPVFYTKGAKVSASEIYVLPVHIADGRTNYAVALGRNVKVTENG